MTEKSLSFQGPRVSGSVLELVLGRKERGVDGIKLIPKSVIYAGFFSLLFLLFSVRVGGRITTEIQSQTFLRQPP